MKDRLTTAPQPLERPQGSLAVLVLFVGRRYYLRPIILWPARSLGLCDTAPRADFSGIAPLCAGGVARKGGEVSSTTNCKFGGEEER